MRPLDSKERKVLLIGGVSLVVAVVTFGLLQSSGTFNNSTYNLGGSIVGFLATAYLLNKVYGSDAVVTSQPDSGDASYSSEDSLKVLDFLTQKQGGEDGKQGEPPSRAVLTEIYKLRKLRESSAINFGYATTGRIVEGRSVSHPRARWTEITKDSLGPGEDQHLVKKYEIQLDLDELAQNEVVKVQNVVTYANAFDGKEKEWFHTHIDIPTRSVTIIILFPEWKPCQKVIGKYKVGENRFTEVTKPEDRPSRLEDGRVVYWSITSAQLGTEYQVEWEW